MSQSRLKADTLASSVVMLLIVTVLQRTVGLGRGVLFCRWLEPETLGQWEMVYSFLLLGAPLAVLGVPGSFGRYLEHYSQRGHLYTFLSRTTIWTGACAALAVVVVAAMSARFSQLLFGSPDHARLVSGVALCLAAVILHHTLISMFNALRLFRVVSAMNFAQSILFASLALGLLSLSAGVESILIGYGAGCLLASLGAMLWAWPALKGVPRPAQRLPQREFWPRLMQFALFVWVTNVLAHLFAIVDRYMIVHFSGLGSSTALEQVGYYHSSRIVPLLMVSFADMLSGLVMPHLSRDWEAGRKSDVRRRVKICLKITGLGMLAFGVCVLVFAPLLFDVVLQGKYSDGLAVLPWTMAACIWFGMYLLAQNYLWCAEKTRLATMPLAIGLGINIGLNLLLLPTWGLIGAVVATAISTFVCLTTLLLLSARHGLTLDLGLWLVAIAPLALAGGEVAAAVVLVALVAATPWTSAILNREELGQLRDLLAQSAQKIKTLLPGRLTRADRA